MLIFTTTKTLCFPLFFSILSHQHLFLLCVHYSFPGILFVMSTAGTPWTMEHGGQYANSTGSSLPHLSSSLPCSFSLPHFCFNKVFCVRLMLTEASGESLEMKGQESRRQGTWATEGTSRQQQTYRFTIFEETKYRTLTADARLGHKPIKFNYPGPYHIISLSVL